MGYTTEFSGEFRLSRKLTQEENDTLVAFSDDRHGGPANPYKGFPGFWCDWVPNGDGTALEWNGSEKFYDYVDWLRYLIDNFFRPRGITLDGTVHYDGEDDGDSGTITVRGYSIYGSGGSTATGCHGHYADGEAPEDFLAAEKEHVAKWAKLLAP